MTPRKYPGRSGASDRRAPDAGVRVRVAVQPPGHREYAYRSTLAGRPLTAARLLSFSSHPAAAVAYGRGVGTIIVLEQRSTYARIPHASEGDGPGLSLPSVSIHGSSGQQLQTAIGTLVRFTRDGVSYTVLGSVDASTADAAARGL